MKLKTLKDMKREVYGSNSGDVLEHVKQEAILWLCWILKKNANPFNTFMEFHNIEHNDLLKGGEEE